MSKGRTHLGQYVVGIQTGGEPDCLAPLAEPALGRDQQFISPVPIVAVVMFKQGKPDRHRVNA